jgi:hypothetical protein
VLEIPLFSGLEIVFVKLAKIEVKAFVMAGNGNAHAPAVGVEDFIAFVCVVGKEPFVKGYGFLCGVYSVRLLIARATVYFYKFLPGFFK